METVTTIITVSTISLSKHWVNQHKIARYTWLKISHEMLMRKGVCVSKSLTPNFCKGYYPITQIPGNLFASLDFIKLKPCIITHRLQI